MLVSVWRCHEYRTSTNLEPEFCSPPVSPLCIISDLGICLEPKPVRNRSVLLHLLCELCLNLESLLRRHCAKCNYNRHNNNNNNKSLLLSLLFSLFLFSSFPLFLFSSFPLFLFSSFPS